MAERLRVTVVGGSLAGIAAAGRLAKLGHRVTLLEQRSSLGGGYRGPSPTVLLLPAPWRDLFKKSGRPMDAELARHGLALVDGPPAHHRFDDGSELALPGDRAGQFTAISAAYGRPAAERWRDLLDSLVRVWQDLRPLGLEGELTGRRPTRALGRWAGGTVADVARSLDEPHLGRIVELIAWREGSSPERTPAWRAARLAVERTFGRWQLVDAAGTVQPLSTMLDVLTERLATRRVEVRTDTVVSRIRSATAWIGEEEIVADALVATIDPWQLGEVAARPSGSTRGLLPAWAPTRRTERRTTEIPAGHRERVEHTATGPVLCWEHTEGGATVVTTHDLTEAARIAEPSAGLRWRGGQGWRGGQAWRGWWIGQAHRREWLARPRTTTDDPRLVLAGPWLPGGPHPDEQLLSGALASAAVHRLVEAPEPR